MNEPLNKKVLRFIPPVDAVLGAPGIAGLRERYPQFPWTRLARGVIDDFRAGKHGDAGADRSGIAVLIESELIAAFEELRSGGVRRVINATGVILHTNLGRAVLGVDVQDAVREALAHYVTLEYDTAAGVRAKRAPGLTRMVALATGAEAAMVVNNNAAAVHIVIDSFSPPGRVVVSRGELVEIGGSFRLPDILDKAASEVIEVGTTNRTYIDDYAKVAVEGDVLLKVHRSNYDIRGFAHETEIGDLVTLARERGCHVVFDLGSGSLFDYAGAGIRGEEVVASVLGTGVDCVTMSGDKLLGGVQSGLIVGTRRCIGRIRDNPLRRALRVDKITVAALQALFRCYLFDPQHAKRIPVLMQATETVRSLRSRAKRIVSGLKKAAGKTYEVGVVDDVAAIGGGSFANQDVESVAIAITCRSDKAAETLAKRLRQAEPPIIARIKDKEVRLNLRSVLPYEDTELTRGVESILVAEHDEAR